MITFGNRFAVRSTYMWNGRVEIRRTILILSAILFIGSSVIAKDPSGIAERSPVKTETKKNQINFNQTNEWDVNRQRLHRADFLESSVTPAQSMSTLRTTDEMAQNATALFGSCIQFYSHLN